MKHRRLVVLISIALLALLACAKKLTDLEPYPCAADGSCPDGRACTPDLRCAAAALDSVCRTGETDCTTATPGGTCALGACGQPCDGNRQTCPDGRVCSVSTGAGGSGGCLKQCEADKDCPTPLRCRVLDNRNGKTVLACVAPSSVSVIGGSCKETQDCTAQGAALACINGVCTKSCSTTSECGTGYVCPPGGGGCLRDCSTANVCDADQVCSSLWTGGLRGCTAAAAPVAACDRVEVVAPCLGLCGSSLDTKLCPTTGACPSEATCGASNTCTCPSKNAYHCDGTICSTSKPCAIGDYWCEPSNSPSCDANVAKLLATCRCRDGRSLPTLCGSNASCESRCEDECDVVKQDCKDPIRSKCANVTEGSTNHHRCVAPPAVPKREGEICRRASADEVGSDDCEKGLFCSLVRRGGETVCRRFCEGSEACKPTDICLSFFSVDVQGDDGLCRPRCTMPDGPECGENARCLFGGCFANSAVALGLDAECTLDIECQAGYSCNNFNRCVPFCNTSYPCPNGYQCGLTTPQPDAGPAKFGLCVKDR